MTPEVLLWLTVGGVAISSFAAIGVRSLREFSRHDLQLICQRRGALDRFGEILHRHDQVALGVDHLVKVSTTLAITSGAWLVAMEVGALDWRALLATVAAGAVALAVAVVWIPTTFARLWAEPLLYRTWRFWKLVSAVMGPPVYVARIFDAVAHRLAGKTHEAPSEETIEEEIRTIVNEGHREGLLEEDAREMIKGVIELSEAEVSEIMTPRTDMHMIHVGLSWEGMLDEVIKSGHTRIPVFESNRDDVVGILYSKDLLPEMAKGAREPRRPLVELLRSPHFVPESKKVDDLLQSFQKTRNHMAVVLDEYGGVSGLVTIEDALEEIVGEIVDEYDDELVEEIKKIDNSTCEALGRAHVDEINEAIAVDLPEDGDFDTIGGFVFGELGHIPEPGETLEWRGRVRITVLEASQRRIDRVRVETIGESTRESA